MKKLSVICAAALGISLTAGCKNDAKVAELVNEKNLSLSGIEVISVSYDEEDITFFQSSENELVIREYMTDCKPSYCAKIRYEGGRLEVSEGGKPFFKNNFFRYVEVGLPVRYEESLIVTTTSGTVDFSLATLDTKILRAETTSGKILISKAKADTMYLITTRGEIRSERIEGRKIKLESTSGNIVCEGLIGNVEYTSTNGSLSVHSAIGCGSYTANNSGELQILYEKLTGDLSMYNKNDDIELYLPADSVYSFLTETKNGTVRTEFENSSAVRDDFVFSVALKSVNGNINVRKSQKL